MNQTNFNHERVKGRSRRKGSQPSGGAPVTKESQPSGGAQSSPVSRRKPKRTFGRAGKAVLTVGCLILGLAVAGGAFYTYKGIQYQETFFPKTTINGMDASGRTPEEVKEMIASQIKGYALTLETRQQAEDVIKGLDIGLHPEYDGTLERLLSEQDPMMWGFAALKDKEYVIGTMVAYDQALLETAIDQMACMDGELAEAPVDAHISDYIEGIGYEIVPERQGTLLNRERVLAGVAEALLNLQERLNLDEIGAYEAPTVFADDSGLQSSLEAWNRYGNVTVTYQFGSSREVLDGSVIHQWLSDDGQYGVILNEAQVAQYVKDLAREYNTAYQPKTLKTSYGKTVTITGGPYGWRINQSAEAAALAEILRSGESQTREPIYSQTANSHDGPDYGDTYVEINLTAQHLYFYKDGKLLVESDFVSGNESRGWGTPAGAYPLTYKQRNATLRGENYETPVSYWMPFNGNIGMHDADWRDSFGGSIYKTNGSHGCVNLPPAVAKKIYENIEAGIPVLCYNLGGTGSSSSSTAAKPAETTAAETTAAETTAAETTAAQASIPETAAPAETTAPAVSPAETTAAVTSPPGTTGAETKPSATIQNQTGNAPASNTQTTPGASPAPSTQTTPTPSTQTVPGPSTGGSGGAVSGPAAEESKVSSGVVSGPGQ